MRTVKYLVLGAGISGISFAYEKRNEDYLIIEKESEIGGLCRSFYAPGFVWDVAGHFLHFHSEATKKFVLDILGDTPLSRVNKCAKIYYGGKYMNAPFQYNIHELEQKEFLECLTDLYYAKIEDENISFKDFVRQKFGHGIADKFLIPYNEKLYACDLNELDRDSMGKFLPKLTFDMLMTFYKGQKGTTYNDFFLYPTDGIVKFLNCFLEKISMERIHLNEEVLAIDVETKVVHTSIGDYKYEYLINTMPLNQFVKFSGVGNYSVFHSNKIVVLNLGFDKPSLDKEVNWTYFPGDEVFYRVGWYNNIAVRDKLSLYVEIGCRVDDEVNIQSLLDKTLVDLRRVHVIEDHKLESYHYIVVPSAYVHVSKEGKSETEKVINLMKEKNVYMIGRYARWEYSAIDDSIEQAKELSINI